MISSATRSFVVLFAVLTLAMYYGFAQQPSPSPGVLPAPTPTPEQIQPEQDAIRTVTEEIQITVTSLDSHGRLDPTLELADILVLEDGVAQELRSARRVPAHVLLLLDTGGEINSAKRVRLTREIARNLVTTLNPQDEIAIMQFNSKVELLQNWTIDKDALLQTLDQKLLSGKRARFLDAIMASASHLSDRPQGNRHVVMITDGVQSSGERVDRNAAMRRFQAANAVVHVVSYTTVSRQATAHDRKYTRKRDKSLVPDAAIETLPRTPNNEAVRRAHEPGGIIVDLDPERRRAIKQYEAAMRASEAQLAAMAEESGGRIWLPETAEEMIDDGARAARLIDSQFVVTYKPRRSLATSREGEVRRIEVASRRVGLTLVSRRQFVIPPSASASPDRARRVAP
ncbi:MAG TPA: VWA domain-containing protein [Pyrinomonadaceae bacterium]|nr:VWA domain-containing protein [Pyrinomonadaceae bacterium]